LGSGQRGPPAAPGRADHGFRLLRPELRRALGPPARSFFEKKTADGENSDLDIPETLEEILQARKIDPEKLPELREKVERVQTLIKMVGSSVGRDTTLKWVPGYMWAIYPDENTATYPLEHLLTHSPEEIVGLTDHEALHREITVMDQRYPLVRKFAEDPIKHFLWNGLEDPRVNSRGIHKLPGAERYLHAAYDRYLPEEIDIDAAREWAVLGDGPNVPEGDGASVFNPAVLQYPHIEFIMAANYFWRYGKRPAKFLNKSAEKAFDDSLEEMKKVFEDYPRDNHPDDDEKLARSLSALNRIDEKILPLYEPLVKESQEKLAKRNKRNKGKNKKGKGKGKQGGSGAIPPDPKDKRQQKQKPEDGQGGGQNKGDEKKPEPDKDDKSSDKRPGEKTDDTPGGEDKDKKPEEGRGSGGKSDETRPDDKKPGVGDGGEPLSDEDLRRALKELQDHARDASGKLGSRLKENPKRKDAGLGKEEKDLQGKGAGPAPTASSGEGNSEALTIEDIADRQREMRMEEERTPYKRSQSRVAPMVGQMVSRFENIFFKNSRPKDVGHFRKGKKPDMKRAIRREKEGGWKQDIWLRRVHNTKRSYSVTILIDESGSMGGNLREALDTVVLMLEGLTRLRIEVEIIGFNETARLYKKFDDPLTPAKREEIAVEIEKNLGSGMTHDADAVQLALDRIASRQTDQKGIFVVTDGAGNGNSSISAVLPKAEKAGVFVMGVGIGGGMAYVKEVYPQHSLVDKISELPASLYSQLEEYFHSVERSAAAQAAGRSFSHAVSAVRNGVTGPASPSAGGLPQALAGWGLARAVIWPAAAGVVAVALLYTPALAALMGERSVMIGCAVAAPLGFGIGWFVLSHLADWKLSAWAFRRYGLLLPSLRRELAALRRTSIVPLDSPQAKTDWGLRWSAELLRQRAARLRALAEFRDADGTPLHVLPMVELLAMKDADQATQAAAVEYLVSKMRNFPEAEASLRKVAAAAGVSDPARLAAQRALEESTGDEAGSDESGTGTLPKALSGVETREESTAALVEKARLALESLTGLGLGDRLRREAVWKAIQGLERASAGDDADAVRLSERRLEEQLEALRSSRGFHHWLSRPMGLAGLDGALGAKPGQSWGQFAPRSRGWMALEVAAVLFFFLGALTELNNGIAFLGGMIGFWTGMLMDQQAGKANVTMPMRRKDYRHIDRWYKTLVKAKGKPVWDDFFRGVFQENHAVRLKALESLRNAGPWADPDLAELLGMLARAATTTGNFAKAVEILGEMGADAVLDELALEGPAHVQAGLAAAKAASAELRESRTASVAGIVENVQEADAAELKSENEALLDRANDVLRRLPDRSLALRAKREGLARAILRFEDALKSLDGDKIQIAAERLKSHLAKIPAMNALFASPARAGVNGALGLVKSGQAIGSLGPADTLAWLAYAAYVPALFLLDWPFMFLPALLWSGAMMYLSFFKYRDGGIEALLLFMSGMSPMQMLISVPAAWAPWVSAVMGLGSVGLLMLVFAHRHTLDWGTYLAMRRARKSAGLDELGPKDQYRKLVRYLFEFRGHRLAVLKGIKGYPGSIRRLLPLIAALAVRDRAPGVGDAALELILEIAPESESGFQALREVAESGAPIARYARSRLETIEQIERRNAEELLDKLAQEEASKEAVANTELLAAAQKVLDGLSDRSFSARQRRQAVEHAMERFQQALQADDEDAVRLARDRLKEQIEAARNRMGFFAGGLGGNFAVPSGAARLAQKDLFRRAVKFLGSEKFMIGLLQASWIGPGLLGFVIGWNAIYALGAALPAAMLIYIVRTFLRRRLKTFGHPFADAGPAVEVLWSGLDKRQKKKIEDVLRPIPKRYRRSDRLRVSPGHPSELLIWSMPDVREMAWREAYPLLRKHLSDKAVATLQGMVIREAGRSLFKPGNPHQFKFWIRDSEYERLSELGEPGRDQLISLLEEDFGEFHTRMIRRELRDNVFRWSWKGGSLELLRNADPGLAAEIEQAFLPSMEELSGELERGGEDVLDSLLARAARRIDGFSGTGISFIERKRAEYLRGLVHSVESLRDQGDAEALAVEVKRLKDALAKAPMAMIAGRSAARSIPGLNGAAGQDARFFSRVKRFLRRPDVIAFLVVPAVEAAVFGGMLFAVMNGYPIPKQLILISLIGSGILAFGKGENTKFKRFAALTFFVSLSAFLALGAVNHSPAELPVLVPLMWFCVSFLLTYVMVGAVRKARMDFLPYASRGNVRRSLQGLDLDARQRDWERMLSSWHKDRFAALGEMLENPAEAALLKPAVHLLAHYETFPGVHGRLIELLGWWGDDASLAALMRLRAHHEPGVRAAAEGMVELVQQRRKASEEMDKILKPVERSSEGPPREAEELLSRAREMVGDVEDGPMPRRIWKRAVKAAADNLTEALASGEKAAILVAIERLRRQISFAAGRV